MTILGIGTLHQGRGTNPSSSSSLQLVPREQGEHSILAPTHQSKQASTTVTLPSFVLLTLSPEQYFFLHFLSGKLFLVTPATGSWTSSPRSHIEPCCSYPWPLPTSLATKSQKKPEDTEPSKAPE